MTATVMTTATEPDGAPRVASLDILRGIAILGILFMNINDMGGSLNASFDDIRHLGWTSADRVAWWLREVLANGTARCLLEMLFGVGMVILTDRAADAAGVSGGEGGWLRRGARRIFGSWAVLRPYYARNLVLFAFGIVHIFILMWPGDILHTYGIAALIAFLFRRLGPKTLLFIGGLMALLQLFGAGIGLTMAQRAQVETRRIEAKQSVGKPITADERKTLKKAAERKVEKAKDDANVEKRIAIEDKARSAATGTATTWFASAWRTMLWLWGVPDTVGEGMFLEPLFVWEAAGTMLIGAALYKWGVIQGLRSRRFYLRAMLIAYAVAIPCRLGMAWAETRFDDGLYLIYATSEVARLAMTLGHIAAVYVLLATATGTRLLKPFEAAGRTALTIYIAQTIICLWILYPPFALGLYGTQGWMALMITALAVNAVLLFAANWYVRHYRIAPVEWAWRSIIARKALPFRRRGGSSAGGAVPVAA
ncbi:DUF418 domain-containing protein [Sphingomonas sp. RS2018]